MSSSPFDTIPLSPRLMVPIICSGLARPRAAGTVVACGEALTDTGVAPAPVAGTIVGPTRVTLLNGTIVDAVEMATDPEATTQSEPALPRPPAGPIHSTDLGKWIDRLEQFGVGAMRSASPDLLGQLRQAMDRPIRRLLCCALDSDPSLQLNSATAKAYTTEMAAGIDLLVKLTGPNRVWVAIDPTVSAKSLNDLNPMARADGLRVIQLPGDYPQADPTVLLHTLLDRRLRPGRLPTEEGVLMLDAPAAVAVGLCFGRSQKMLDVPIAVRDHVAHKSYLLIVPIGTPLSDLCAALNVPEKSVLLRGGDFLRDIYLPATAVVGPGELMVHITARQTPTIPDPCVRCGWCIEACPTGVHPARLLEASQRDDEPLAKKFGVHACIECGICSYVCPSRLPLLGSIRKLKTIIGADK
jgi:Na+-translocating ferredoxin:NAD+ oxidoreductase subunit C